MSTKLQNFKLGLFARRDSIREVQDWIELHPPQERIQLYTVLGMTLNTMAHLIKTNAIEDVRFIPKGRQCDCLCVDQIDPETEHL